MIPFKKIFVIRIGSRRCYIITTPNRRYLTLSAYLTERVAETEKSFKPEKTTKRVIKENREKLFLLLLLFWNLRVTNVHAFVSF